MPREDAGDEARNARIRNPRLAKHDEHENHSVERLGNRRTCYVGITRAQRKLYLTYARQRMLYGRPNAFPSSRFLAEIPEEYKEELVSDGYGAFMPNQGSQSGSFGGFNGFGSAASSWSRRMMSLSASTATLTEELVSSLMS